MAQGYRIHLSVQEMQVPSLCWEEPLKNEMPTHSIILAWTEDPGGLQTTGSQESDMTKQQQQQHMCVKWIVKKNKKWILSSICIGSEDIHISHVTYNASMFSKKPLLNIHFISFSSDSEPVSYYDLSYFFNISQAWFLLCYLVLTLFFSCLIYCSKIWTPLLGICLTCMKKQ